MSNIAYLSLGTNLGDRILYFKKAVERISQEENILIKASSSIYETDPVGFVNQGKFLNIVLKIETDLTAGDLLDVCMEIEKELGRIRYFKWGPRTIDLDILMYNQENIETERLIIPHPRMHERAFVLIPLLEIDPLVKHPTLGIPLIEQLETIQDKEGVKLWRQINGVDVFELFES
ncbi:2-amino-4-hydroxy-6-hydroxymethyldihydropteridine diphosphokinase [Oikeobacillus pervagus]|uniref:2-amino-4-hydroxy-6-hydroxymethyldihydropteridine diphosphokinase n=1 Tax=Oikeobacillus pervagus TaxID=1325931 RepID=A0AAJ1T0D3_9BACI|nr:2-amino-4-hydroxy-6-hydroxymethyldihydropteridine diphosphokinase [Oikeobacillus pervagus]MDQ0216173.1 2-amino-4-hydroxy-6-hydroxymethyldihydropteridine diphosphokinase [Oikeobacillus pervagus]